MARAKKQPEGEDLKNVRVRGGSYQVRVYVGVDPVTNRPCYLTGSTRDVKKIREIRTALQAQVDKQRSASTNATLAYTLDQWLPIAELDHSTRHGYEGYVRRNIKQTLGDLPISKIKPQVLESFYVTPRRDHIG